MTITFTDPDEKKLTAEELKEVDKAWGNEVERRLTELRTGNRKAIPSDEVHQYVRAHLSKIQHEKS
ncbi:MAG: hypothetical protein C4527_14085 [Candidatus Omnitrophota bacterium]|nr:MAG: hypothetical protein C4527_14085 [Candidatus Omnitrophota bacterium]